MENERVNGVYASPNNIEFVLDGKTMTHMMSKWWIITKKRNVMGNKKIAPVHPGEILLEEVPKPMGISQR
ncbi:MAG: hypothetical protein ACQEQO_05240 [Thermodesulfobacteriota bacterium]